MKQVFKKDFLEQQKAKLLELRSNILNSIQSKEDLEVPSDEVIEEGDQAQIYLDQNVSFGLREREFKRLKEIEYALSKIESGGYGVCEEYDEPIEQARLVKMPWAKYCIEAAEELEREQRIA